MGGGASTTKSSDPDAALCASQLDGYFGGDAPVIDALSVSNPTNLCVKYLKKVGRAYVEKFSPKEQLTFMRCVKTGVDNPDSGVGCYAMTPADYTTFGAFFNQVIGDYHKNDPACAATHTTDWEMPAECDLKALGLTEELSMRVRVGRNLLGYNLPGMMDKDERVKLEKQLLGVFDKIIAQFGGKVHSLTPDFGNGEANPNLITDAEYQALVDAHVMFKDMDADCYLKSAGISSGWPYGRGCWQSEDKSLIIWFGEEDHLRIMCMKGGFILNDVFDGLKKLLDVVAGVEGMNFAKTDRFGFVTSCPTNLGTGMRASVHIKVPNLTSDGTDTKAKEICSPLGLSVRGTGGEHTPIGADGTVDISPRARLFITEAEVVAKLFGGLKDLIAAEQAAAQ